MLNKRSRIVSIRLSEDEFQKLAALCTRVGARSVSDLARQRLVYSDDNEDRSNPGVNLRLSQLDRDLNSLREEVARIAAIVSSREPKGTASHAAHSGSGEADS